MAQPLLVERGAGVILGQHVLEGRVVALDAGHGSVDKLANGRLARLGLQIGPAGFLRHPEDVLGDVLVAILGSLSAPFGQHRRMTLLEGVGDVFQKDKSEDDVLVLSGIHRSAQCIGHAPELGFVAGRGTRALRAHFRGSVGLLRLSIRHWSCYCCTLDSCSNGFRRSTASYSKSRTFRATTVNLNLPDRHCGQKELIGGHLFIPPDDAWMRLTTAQPATLQL